MKKLLIILLLLPGCAGWTVNGVPADRFRHMEVVDVVGLVAGGAASFGTHTASHAAAFALFDIDWHMDGTFERYNGADATSSQRAWIGRSGPVGQLLVGWLIRKSPWRRSMFATGYHMATVYEITTYPIWCPDEGDFDEISYHGDPDLEYVLYSGASIWLLDLGRDKK